MKTPPKAAGREVQEMDAIILIGSTAEEIAALALALQGRQDENGITPEEFKRIVQGYVKREREQRNINWAVQVLPENCRSLFVCMDGEIFDRWVKNGVVPSLDDRDRKSSASIPCFIGYAATSDPKVLDILAGVREAKPDEAQPVDRPNHAGS